MRILLAAIVLSSLPALAASSRALPLTTVLLGQTPPPQSPPSTVEEEEDEEEDEDEAPEAPAAPATPAAPAAPQVSGEAPAAAPNTQTGDVAATPVTPVNPAQNAHEQQLISGAPLHNPDVAVHIVEKKQFSDSGKNEIALYPAAVQVNGKFANHIGSAISYTYHVNENFAFQLTPQYNWYNREAGFNEELVQKVGQLPQAATSLLLKWATQAGVEVTPIYGKFAFYEGNLAHFSFVLNGGAGVGSTRSQIKQVTRQADGREIPATYGDAGLRFIGSVGAGFRVQVGDRFAIRLEMRDLVYTARVDSVNGCNIGDLDTLDQFTRTSPNRPLSEANVSGGCDVENFEGVDPESGYERARDIPLAQTLVRTPSSDVLNNVGFYAGFSFLF